MLPIAGIALAIGLFLYARVEPRTVADWAKTNDPILAQLLSLNPALNIEGEFSRAPVYWIKNSASGRKIIFQSRKPGTPKSRFSGEARKREDGSAELLFCSDRRRTPRRSSATAKRSGEPGAFYSVGVRAYRIGRGVPCFMLYNGERGIRSDSPTSR